MSARTASTTPCAILRYSRCEEYRIQCRYMPTPTKQNSDPTMANASVRQNRSMYQVGMPLVEPEPIGQVVSQCDQPRIQRQLRKRMAVDRKGCAAEPAAHPGQCIGRGGAKTRA